LSSEEFTYVVVHFVYVFRGVTAVAYSRHGRIVYTAGADGMVCKIDPSDGSVAGKFKSSSKAISALAVSSGISVMK
jgi:U3 small nucleolar RNA-associated protein 5